MMADKVIEAGSLREASSGFIVNVRLPWYRSLPLSTVEIASLSVDGHRIPDAQIRFAVNGREWPLDELPRLTHESWFVVDSAELRVSNQALKRGTEHEIEVVLGIYPPYIKNFRRLVRWARKMRVN